MTASAAATLPLPAATYRLQFHAGFKLRHALEIVEYLAQLGVSHLYASPLTTARPGSTHGYDVIDHNTINPELGSDEDFDELVRALQRNGMGLILDIVPNHMGVGGQTNAWWLDTLEWGQASAYARFFDIDFSGNRPDTQGKVMLPLLADQYGKVLAQGDLELKFDAESGAFSAWYHEHRFPIDPRSYWQIAEASLPNEQRDWLARFAELGPMHAGVREAGENAKQELAQRAAGDQALARRMADAAAALRGRPGELGSWQRLHELLESQNYRLAHWRAAADEINYRRFFNINDLAGIRVELQEVFDATHRRVLEWTAQGLRIDHIDGLFDPAAYCERLQSRAGGAERSAYIAVEKILAAHERLPRDWPIAGTSGYDAVNLINGVFVDPAGERALDRIYRYVTKREESFDDVLYACKKLVMQTALASEMNVLASALHRLSSSDLPTRDFTLRAMRAGIEEVFAYMPVYRTYVTPAGASDQDRRDIEWAIGKAKRATIAMDPSLFDFMRGVLLGEASADATPEQRAARVGVAMRAQQISGPVMAKGMEDTAFYRYHRLISLNEVGGDPRRFGVSVASFHAANAERLDAWPGSMLCASTHDTKRGEDARARINVLSEIPRPWMRQVVSWMRVNRSRRTQVEGRDAMPHPADEYLYYQTLMGAWPLELAATDQPGLEAFAARVQAFMQKALREGKERSSWDNPDPVYEQALEHFVRESLKSSATNPFPEQMASWVHRIARWGAINSLGQTLLRLTMPGVPDTYQGSELWDLSMVDPDNRRPVDYGLRRKLLSLADQVGAAALASTGDGSPLRELTSQWQDGREKLYLVRRVLDFRRQHDALFRNGGYLPLSAEGSRADHVCAFARANPAGEHAVVLVPRLVAKLATSAGDIDWGDTTLALPPGRYRCLFSNAFLDADAPVPLARALAHFPVTVLTSTT